MEPAAPAPNSFAANLDATGRAALAALAVTRAYPPRAVLFHQGDPAGHVAVLLRGWVKVTSVSRGGQEALLAVRGPGDILGEMAAVDGLHRSGTATALMPVTAQVIDGRRFVEAVTGTPDLALALLKHLTNSVREADGKRLEYVSIGSSGRLAGLLLELSARHGRSTPEGIVIDLPLSQRELATAAATSREAVARAMRTLRERDVVRTRRRGVMIVRPDVLHSLHGSASNDT